MENPSEDTKQPTSQTEENKAETSSQGSLNLNSQEFKPSSSKAANLPQPTLSVNAQVFVPTDKAV